ncbi:triphosphoribosyl-dephospho-CoA synthase CitG [Clostridium sp. CX1]|uniref:triphosphoribosyl-dephospho-CoA synthase CitG n=1 Tax=Clostridium sp. CX1 TaxID=2978346 RepID=UPI0021BE95F8|nr:triphosphoribosyl-dephospho-CoA synthase CitG [Clostridium sp. CX1]MCT8976460.1 triphosphoribosyl-dephospho-CoA synthase CitG [Clostridium sp. CX1]
MDNRHTINDISFDIGSLAVKAMMYEVACYPSPGLVSCISNGAHKDMDYYTFIDSTSALIKYLILCVEEGLKKNHPNDVFFQLRKIGIMAERDMYKKTKGVNTHKGMLFLMGICCAAVGIAIRDKKRFLDIRQIIKDMTEGIVERELEPILREKHLLKDSLSHGEKLFLEHGIKGIRGEIEKGLPVIFDFSLEFYKLNSDLNKNDRLVHTLIGIMQYSEDTNILHRHSLDVLQDIHKKARDIISLGGMKTIEGKKAIQLLDAEFIERNISPGGSADLLAITVFLHMVEDYIRTI